MNPFVDARPLYGQDPYILRHEAFHLLVESVQEERIQICVVNPATMRRVTFQTVWDNPEEHQVWAPELHKINGYYFIYYSSSDGENRNHRMKILCASEPFGPYHFVRELVPESWGIDMTTFTWEDKRYAVWSGWENNNDEFPQNLYIASMETPVEVGERYLLSSPLYDWELSIKPINEGPQAFIKKGRLFLLFSANASWTQNYATGLLELAGSTPLNQEHWVKHIKPLALNVGHGMIESDTFWYHRKQNLLWGWQDREIVAAPAASLLDRIK